jgi:hypothetical protein
MKIQPSRNQGNTLLLVMMITGIVIAALGVYLSLALQEHAIVKRSFCWNAAMPMAEAGIEEVLSHLNQNKTNFVADGWTTNSPRTRYFGDDYYSAWFEGAPGGLVTITSSGFIKLPDNQYLSRTVRLRGFTARDFKFPGLMAGSINFGGTLGADSYDSSDPALSTNGQYDPAKWSDQALIATPGLGFSMQGNSHVFGYVATGPGGTVSTGGASSVGDRNYAGKGIQPGHMTNNFTLNAPSVQVPYTEADLPVPGTVNGITYDYVLAGGNYMIPDLNSTAYGGTIYVDGSCVLYVTGTVSLNKIVFSPDSRLDLFVGGPSVTFAPAIVGATAPMFTVFVLPTCTSLSLVSQTLLTGLFYAPDTALVARGGAEIAGAIVGRTFTCNGNFTFHYDMAFSKPRTLPPVRIYSWAEL